MWLVFDQKVNGTEGPYDEKKIKEIIKDNPKVLIWQKGYGSSWISADEWSSKIKEEKINKLLREKEKENFFIEIDSEIFGPLSQKSLIDKLTEIKGDGDKISKTFVYAIEGEYVEKDKVNVFENIELIKELNIPIRKNPRVTLSVQAIVCKVKDMNKLHDPKNFRENMLTQVLSLSSEGMGLNNKGGIFKVNDTVKIQIKDNDVNLSGIEVYGKVLYNNNGALGLKFINLSAEGRSRIVGYIRNRFSDEQYKNLLKRGA